MPDLSKLSTEELIALLYNPQKTLEDAGNPSPAGSPPKPPVELEKNPMQSPEVQKFLARFPRFGEHSDILDASGLPPNQLKDAAIDAGVGAAGNLAGEGLMSPVLSSTSRFLNSLLSGAKGVGLNEAMTRGATALKGNPQPPITDPGQMLGDAVSGGLGLFHGAGVPAPAPEDPRIAWLARKKFLDAELKRTAAKTPNIASAKKAAAAAYENHQKTLSDAAKQVGQDSAEDIADRILEEEKNLATLKTRAQQGFEPDPKDLETVREGIKKYRTQVEQADVPGMRFKDERGRFMRPADAKRLAQKRLQEHNQKLDELMDSTSSAEQEHQQKILDSINKVKELRLAQRRARTGAFDTIPTNNDVAEGKKAINLKQAMEDAENQFAEHQKKIEQLKIAQANHSEAEPPKNEEADKLWEKFLKFGKRGGVPGVVTYNFARHLGLPHDIATEISIGVAAGANSPQAQAAKLYLQKNLSPDALRAVPLVATGENSK